MLDRYSGISPKNDIRLIKLLGRKFKGRSFLNINSTKAGGGVAEILQRLVPILDGIGIEARWEVIEGDTGFFETTKKIHNAIQGNIEHISRKDWEHYFEVNRQNARKLNLGADIVFIHDPQPLPLIEFRPAGGNWVWRCHIDFSSPYEEVSGRLMKYSSRYDAAIFSVPGFARIMRVPEFIVLPSIDPLSEKNRDLSPSEIEEVADKFGIPRDRPVILQVSRYDRFKDPVGVIKAFRMAKKYNDCVLVLAGSPATDDPEGEEVLKEVREFANGDPDIKILLLPPFRDKEINALQRIATVVLQKSIKEGFGLTVSETMWKGKPVIGGATGGIPYQITEGINGYLVYSVEGAAFRIRQLLNNPEMLRNMGMNAKEYVRNNFLITRQVRDYLSVWAAVEESSLSTIMV